MTKDPVTSNLSGHCVVLSVVISVATYGLLQGLAWMEAGVFEYPLDDVYIHLAVSEQIAAGGYGVNAGEYTSAASSPLYPLLLAPFSGGEMHRWSPAAWNLLALIMSAALWGRVVSSATDNRRWAFGLALLGPLAFNLPGLAFVGMEHMLHVLTVMAVLRGLQIHFDEQRIGWILIAGMLLGPLLRFEGLAVTGGAALTIALTGRLAAGALLFACAALLLAGFSVFLTLLGLDPLPNSVIAKLSGIDKASRFSLDRLHLKFLKNLSTDKGIVLFLMISIAAASLLRNRKRSGIAAAVLLGAILAGLGHMLFGQFGWLNRYEIYAICFVIGLVTLAFLHVDALKSTAVISVICMLWLALSYNSWLFTIGRFAPLGIYSQQGNMSTFVKEYYRKPIAVNDLGYVSWQNPNYVLDLWGLASSRALRTRLDNPQAGWMGEIAHDHNVKLIVVYDKWFGAALARHWINIGHLDYVGPTAYLGGLTVSFYATDPAEAPKLRELLEDFSKNVRGAARLTVVEREI